MTRIVAGKAAESVLFAHRSASAPIDLREVTISNLNNPTTAELVTLAFKHGATAGNGLLEPTPAALSEIAERFPGQKLVVRKNGQPDQIIAAKEVMDLDRSKGVLTIGLLYATEVKDSLIAIQRNRFPNGTATEVEELSLERATISLPKTDLQLQAERDFYDTIKKCTLPPEDYRKWIHIHKADFGVDQFDLEVGGWFQLTYDHLKLLARTDPDKQLMFYREDLPVSPSMRWQSETVKSALFKENERRSLIKGKMTAENMSAYYVFCADPERAYELALEQPTGTDRVNRALAKLQTQRWFQKTAIVVSVLSAALIGIFNDSVKQGVKSAIRWATDVAAVSQPAGETERSANIAANPEQHDSSERHIQR